MKAKLASTLVLSMVLAACSKHEPQQVVQPQMPAQGQVVVQPQVPVQGQQDQDYQQQQAPVVQQQPGIVYTQPQVVQQVPVQQQPVIVQQHDNTGNVLAAGMMGYMLGGGGGSRDVHHYHNSYPQPQQTTVIREKTIIRERAPAPVPPKYKLVQTPQQRYQAPVSAAPKPAVQSNITRFASPARSAYSSSSSYSMRSSSSSRSFGGRR